MNRNPSKTDSLAKRDWPEAPDVSPERTSLRNMGLIAFKDFGLRVNMLLTDGIVSISIGDRGNE